MCGIFGFSGQDKANIAKLKILGMFNQTRGKDSCGYYFNDSLVKGTFQKKEWVSFIESNIIDQRGKSNLFIGHTRYGTVGANTEENAHPFNVNDRMVLAHNGTISNIWELCRKHGIDHTGINVDSLALGHLLDKVGVSVLEEYKGFAALLFTRLAEPDSLYVYHGASRVFEKDELPTEERPMFFMRSTEGVYFSSMKNSLLAIRDNEFEEPQMLEHNRLIKVTKGKFAKSKVIIKRDNVNVGIEKKNTTVHTQGNPGSSSNITTKNNHSNLYGRETATTKDGTNTELWRNILPASNNGMGTATLPSLSDFSKEPILIHHETKPPRCFDPSYIDFEFLYFWKGRYWHSDNNVMADGVYITDKDGVIYEKTGKREHEHYFFRGVMLKSKDDWEKIKEHQEKKDALGIVFNAPSQYNFAACINTYSKYPVTNLPNEAMNVSDSVRFSWWKDQKTVNGGVRPVWGNRNYVFKLGQLMEIKKEDKRDIVLIPIGGTGWENFKIFNSKMPKERPPFNNGVLVKLNGKPIETSEDNIKEKYKPIQGLIPYFDKVYRDIDEVLSECPSTIYDAIKLHVIDMLTNGNYLPDDEEVQEQTHRFIEVSINDGVSFRGNMDDNFSDAEDYLYNAYLDEIAEDDVKAVDKTLFSREVKERLTSDDGVEDAEYEIVNDKKKVSTTEAQTVGEQTKTTIGFANFNDFLQHPLPPPAKVINMSESKNDQRAAIDEFIEQEDRLVKTDTVEAMRQADMIIRYCRFLVNKSETLKSLTHSKFATSLSPKLIRIAQTLKDELQATAEIFGIPHVADEAGSIKTIK